MHILGSFCRICSQTILGLVEICILNRFSYRQASRKVNGAGSGSGIEQEGKKDRQRSKREKLTQGCYGSDAFAFIITFILHTTESKSFYFPIEIILYLVNCSLAQSIILYQTRVCHGGTEWTVENLGFDTHPKMPRTFPYTTLRIQIC